jgi:hypothetical protein
MTAIHRRKMLGVMLGGAAVAAVGLSMIPVPAESAHLSTPKYCPAGPVPHGVHRRKQCWWYGGRGGGPRVCCWRWHTPHGWVRLSPIVH